jgi:hypothetical protein
MQDLDQSNRCVTTTTHRIGGVEECTHAMHEHWCDRVVKLLEGVTCSGVTVEVGQSGEAVVDTLKIQYIVSEWMSKWVMMILLVGRSIACAAHRKHSCTHYSQQCGTHWPNVVVESPPSITFDNACDGWSIACCLLALTCDSFFHNELSVRSEKCTGIIFLAYSTGILMHEYVFAVLSRHDDRSKGDVDWYMKTAAA